DLVIVLDDQQFLVLEIGHLRGGAPRFLRQLAHAAREHEANRRAFSRLALDMRHPARSSREAINLAEAKSGAAADALGGEERLERLFDSLGLHPGAVIDDANLDCV